MNSNQTNLINRIRGCLFGGPVGDALGTRYEFSTHNIALNNVATDIKNCAGHLDMLGGGPFGLKPGQYTDDSELGMCLAQALINNNGQYDANLVAKNYIQWFNDGPFDIGSTTMKALRGAENVRDMLKFAGTLNIQSLSNGCLMRLFALPPILLKYYISDNTKELESICTTECALTNPNPIAVTAVVVYVKTICQILTGETNKTVLYGTAIKNIMTFGDSGRLIKSIIEHAWDYTNVVPLTSGHKIKITSNKYGGYLGKALYLAFRELFHGNNFEQSLIEIIKNGGDTDTNACIAGTLLGAYYGFDAIPSRWINTLCRGNSGRFYRTIEPLDKLLYLVLKNLGYQ